MDSLTQSTLGVVKGEALLGKKISNKGAVIGTFLLSYIFLRIRWTNPLSKTILWTSAFLSHSKVVCIWILLKVLRNKNSFLK